MLTRIRSRAVIAIAVAGLAGVIGTSLAAALDEAKFKGLECPPDTHYAAVITYDVSEGGATTPAEAVARYMEQRGASAIGGSTEGAGSQELVADPSSDGLVWLLKVDGQTRARIQVAEVSESSFAVEGLVRCE